LNGTKLEFKRPIGQVLQGRINPYTFEVGVLKDKPHKKPGKGMKPFAGGPARRIGREYDGKTMSEVSADARASLKTNYLIRAFRSKKNKEAIDMMLCFWQLVFGESKLAKKKRLENLIQAVVRNPLTRAEYGRNKKHTSFIKKSSRKFIDTGQLFNSITARVRVNKDV
jgi:hypothetical protein